MIDVLQSLTDILNIRMVFVFLFCRQKSFFLPFTIKKMRRVSVRRLSIYDFAWGLLKVTKKVCLVKIEKEPKIRLRATRRNLQDRPKILKKIIRTSNQNEHFSKKSMFSIQNREKNYQSIKSTNQNLNLSQKNDGQYLKSLKEPKIRLGAT
jgi:hypothetical protein